MIWEFLRARDQSSSSAQSNWGTFIYIISVLSCLITFYHHGLTSHSKNGGQLHWDAQALQEFGRGRCWLNCSWMVGEIQPIHSKVAQNRHHIRQHVVNVYCFLHAETCPQIAKGYLCCRGLFSNTRMSIRCPLNTADPTKGGLIPRKQESCLKFWNPFRNYNPHN